MAHDTVITAARDLIFRHGMRAAATAEARVAEARAQHDHEAAAHWSGVARAIAELRTTERAAA